MSGCRTCNERYGWQFQLWWLMRDAMEEPPPGLADRIMLEVRAQKQPVVRRLPWWKRRRTLAAFAAALAVVVLSPAALRAIRSGLPMQAMQSETAGGGPDAKQRRVPGAQRRFADGDHFKRIPHAKSGRRPESGQELWGYAA